jgi:hypothetical protein
MWAKFFGRKSDVLPTRYRPNTIEGIGEMGSMVHFAEQQFRAAHVS